MYKIILFMFLVLNLVAGSFEKAQAALNKKDFKTVATFHHARSYDYALKSLRNKGKEKQLAAIVNNKKLIPICCS